MLVECDDDEVARRALAPLRIIAYSIHSVERIEHIKSKSELYDGMRMRQDEREKVVRKGERNRSK